MDIENTDLDLSKWFSTYGFITAERLLGRYNIVLPQKQLLTALKIPTSLYHRILQVPLKNILNGIVFQQAHDYHVYAQKLFIDYLLSGESAKEPGSQGSMTRENLEEERVTLVSLGESYEQSKFEHDSLIASTQKVMIHLTSNLNQAIEKAIKSFNTDLSKAGITVKKSQIRAAISHAFIQANLDQFQNSALEMSFLDKMNEVLKAPVSAELKKTLMGYLEEMIAISIEIDTNITLFLEQTQEISVIARSFRTQFYDTILRVNTLISLLPEYRIDPIQDAINRESLHFDNSIGSN